MAPESTIHRFGWIIYEILSAREEKEIPMLAKVQLLVLVIYSNDSNELVKFSISFLLNSTVLECA